MEQIALAVHIAFLALWVGGVFMNRFVVWPTLQRTYAQHKFPLEFLVAQGRIIAPMIYTCIAMVFASGLALLLLRPPTTAIAWGLLAAKTVALLVMAGNVLYGTLVTWPKLQFSTPEETWALWHGYGIRAYTTFVCGIAAILMGAFLRPS
ncbi:MAG: hypothetical protein ACRDZO_19595 [Egibacteraceae bacterium]